jgi:hypothetical protein
MTNIDWLVEFINGYNSIGYGEIHIYETPSAYVLWVYNAGFSENEDMDRELRDSKFKDYIEVDSHPIMILKMRKLNLLRKIYKVEELKKLKDTDHYHKVKKYVYKYEVD